MNKSCIIFGVSINHNDKLYVLHEYLEMIQRDYSDCKVFIGINYGSNDLIEQIIDSYNINVEYARLSHEFLHTSSDDSAYQLALQLFYNDPTRYDICWFMHTKGGFNGRDHERNLYFNEFFSKRNLIEDKFKELPFLGVYGYRAGEFWVDHTNPVDPHITNRFMSAFWNDNPTDNFNCTYCRVILIETMFCLKASLMYTFLDTYPEFFNIKLRRYFFECEISNFLSTKSGYYPASILTSNWANGQDMTPIIDAWISENRLENLTNYKTLTKL